MRLSLAYRRGASVILALVSTIACARTETNAARARPGVSPGLVTPLPPSPDPYLTYLALDFGKPGQPTLTVKELAEIREVLALVKPCQVGLVRYAFPVNSSARFVLFFEAPADLLPGSGYMGSHPFGQPGNVLYEPEQGSLVATPYDTQPVPPGDIEYDIAHTSCTPPYVPRTSAVPRLRLACSGKDSLQTLASETTETNSRLHRSFMHGYRVWKILRRTSFLMVVAPFKTRATAEKSIPSNYIMSEWNHVFDRYHGGCGHIDKWVAFVTAEGKELFTLNVLERNF